MKTCIATARSLCALALMIMAVGANAAELSQAAALAELRQPGRVILMRHALAPGTGDPAHFKLGDCATQRNLDHAGRQQARAAGEMLRAAGVSVEALYSSQWCRCVETAKLLNAGRVRTLPALNSFYEDRGLENQRTTSLARLLGELPRDGGLQVFVTHQVNITALVGEPVSSGEMKVLALRPDGGFEQLGSLQPSW